MPWSIFIPLPPSLFSSFLPYLLRVSRWKLKRRKKKTKTVYLSSSFSKERLAGIPACIEIERGGLLVFSPPSFAQEYISLRTTFDHISGPERSFYFPPSPFGISSLKSLRNEKGFFEKPFLFRRHIFPQVLPFCGPAVDSPLSLPILFGVSQRRQATFQRSMACNYTRASLPLQRTKKERKKKFCTQKLQTNFLFFHFWFFPFFSDRYPRDEYDKKLCQESQLYPIPQKEIIGVSSKLSLRKNIPRRPTNWAHWKIRFALSLLRGGKTERKAVCVYFCPLLKFE